MKNLLQQFLKFQFLLLGFFLVSLTNNSSLNAQSDSCLINGPNSVTTAVQVTYVTTISNQNWEVYSYDGADAQILRFNNDTLVVDTGPSPGRFTVYVLSNPQKEELCSLNVTIDAALPVEMSSFTSSVIEGRVFLYWTTISEHNNSGFNIQRSKTNEEWKSIGFVSGSGSVNTPVNYAFEDRNLQPGIFRYRLKQIDYNGSYQFHDLQNDVVIGSPERFTLYQNYPNPFNPVTRIHFDMASDALVKITVFDIAGKEVQVLLNEYLPQGFHNVEFSGKDLTGGAYFYKLETENFTSVKKMLLVK